MYAAHVTPNRQHACDELTLDSAASRYIAFNTAPSSQDSTCLLLRNLILSKDKHQAACLASRNKLIGEYTRPRDLECRYNTPLLAPATALSLATKERIKTSCRSRGPQYGDKCSRRRAERKCPSGNGTTTIPLRPYQSAAHCPKTAE